MATNQSILSNGQAANAKAHADAFRKHPAARGFMSGSPRKPLTKRGMELQKRFNALAKKADSSEGLTKAARKHLMERLMLTARRFLRAEGVKYSLTRFDQQPAIRILPDASGHPLNRLAAGMMKNIKNNMLYSPGALAKSNSLGFVDPRQRTLCISTASISNLRMDAVTSHELNHAYQDHALALGKPKLFEASAMADDGKLSDVSRSYTDYMSFQEVASFSLEASIIGNRIERFLRQGGDSKKIARARAALFDTADMGLGVAAQAEFLANRMLKYVNSHKDKFIFESVHPGTLQSFKTGVFAFVAFGSTKSDSMTLPVFGKGAHRYYKEGIIKEEPVARQKLFDLMAEQLKQIIKASADQKQAFEKIRRNEFRTNGKRGDPAVSAKLAADARRQLLAHEHAFARQYQ